MRFSVITTGLVALFVLALGACDDNPFQLNWEESQDTVLLYSLARPELNLPAAYNFNLRRRVQVEEPGSTGSWDVALDTDGGELVFLVPGALGLDSRAAINVVTGTAFEDVRRAPADTAAYITDEPVVVEPGPVYIIQTDESLGSFGRICVYYAKVQALEIDPALGTLLFRFDSNPVCNDRDLIPPRD